MGHDPVDGVDQRVGTVRDQVPLEVLNDRGGHHRHLTEVDRTGGPVDRDHVPLVDDDTTRCDRLSPVGVDVDLLGPAHTGLAHTASDHRGVRGLPTTRGQDALRRDHAIEVVGIGLPADQDDRDTGGREFHSPVGIEDGQPDGGPGGCVHTLGDPVRPPVRGEPREHQLGELGTGDPCQRLVHGDQTLVDELDGDPEGRAGGALSDPRLQHPQFVAFDGELDVTQVAVMLLEGRHDGQQTVVRGRVDGRQRRERQCVPDARDDVLALGILQIVAVNALVAVSRVPGERHSGA